MKTYLRRGRIKRDKGDDTLFTELEIEKDGIIITIRRYTSRTFVVVKNEYKHYTRIIWKDYHDKFNIYSLLFTRLEYEYISFSPPERKEIGEKFNKLIEMSIIDVNSLVF